MLKVLPSYQCLYMKIEDPLYGKYFVEPEIAAIIEHPLFARLQDIQQLGLLRCIIPNVSQLTRHDHCLGTYFRASQMIKCLKVNTELMLGNKSYAEYEELPKLYEKAVLIAALLHDIGHGPFSHTWEYVTENYNHEENALGCVDKIMQDLNKLDKFSIFRENGGHGIEVIKSIIVGDPNLPKIPVPRKFMFIYEIVNNRKCKVDVDKWDYLKRDYLYLKGHCPEINMDFDDVFKNARISPSGEHVEYRYEDFHKIYHLFEARQQLHAYCYNIPLSVACNYLLKMILQETELKMFVPDSYDDWQKQEILEFTDVKMWEFIDSTDLGRYIINVQFIIHQQDLKGEGTILDNDGNVSGFYLNYKVRGPGVEMPDDEHFDLYGASRLKQNFVRNCESVDRGGFFKLLPIIDHDDFY